MKAWAREIDTRRPGLFVVGSGLVTSALSLFLVFLLSEVTDGFRIMAFYLNYVFPIGALGVGLVAGSGYGVASWLSSVKISKALLWSVVGLQVGTYFVAQYIDFRHLALCYNDGTPLSFFEYFDYMARSFAWTQADGSAGAELGLWGYAFRLLELAGFALGGLIAPAILFSMPYCDKCQVYMKTNNLCYIPAGVKPEKINKKSVEEQFAYDAAAEQAVKEGAEILSQLQSFSENGQADEFNKLVELLGEQNEATVKLTSRIFVTLAFCSRCYDGFLTPSMLTGQNEEMVTTLMDNIKLKEYFVRQILS